MVKAVAPAIAFTRFIPITDMNHLLDSLIFSAIPAAALAAAPNVVYVFPDQMRNHAMGFWADEPFRDSVNFAPTR